MIREAIGLVVEGKDLDTTVAKSVMMEIMRGEATPAQIGSFITAMRMKGETVNELLGFATAMRECCSKIVAPPGAVDLCGTGGDGLGTFNVSTVASFVVAGSGVPVAKHGNRSVSSRCGSADMLSALGLPIDLDPKSVERVLSSVGIGFMFAPVFHSSMKNVASARREIGIRSYFNILGPMTNPAGVKNQLIGVYDIEIGEKIAKVLRELGSNHVFIVHSNGMDEASNIDETRVIELRDGRIESFTIRPEMFGFERAEQKDILGGGPEENARIALSILSGERSPRTDIVLLNAGLAICASGRTESIIDGVELARESIEKGLALRKMKEFSQCILEIEKERQRSADVRSLIARRIRIDVMMERCAEITRAFIDKCREDGRTRELLGALDNELLERPTPLTVLALNRITRLNNIVEQHLERHPGSEGKLSDSLRAADGIGLIAEYKPRSPASPPMTVAPSPDSAIAAYRTPGVSGVSVLVEPDYFGGGIQLFSQFRSQLEVPMLFKDFIVSEEQLEVASTIGADAVLLIAKLLSSDSLDALIEESARRGLEPLVELHDEADIRKFRELRATDAVKVIGLNSRDFSIMRTNLERIIALRHALPDDKVIIAESGIGSADDVKRLRDFDGVLVGSLLMRALDVKQQVAELVAACRGAKA